jgi:3-oxoacyl-[acyl-carrier protein] reductase
MGRLDGKVALITAGGPNNGGTMAVMMAQEGAKVVSNDIVPEIAEETARAVQAKGGEAVSTVCDVASEEQVKAMVRAGVEAFGYIDTLVNLAGRQHPSSVFDFKLEEWNRELATFLTGAALCMREVANVMVAQGRKGAFINICSIDGLQGHPTRLAYAAVKAGLMNMTRAAAAELAHVGIRVNAVNPGWMEHNLWRRRATAQEPRPLRGRFDVTPQDGLDSIPLGRLIRSTDLAHLAVFLASDESEIITGADIALDGGATSAFHQWVPGRYRSLSVQEYIRTQALWQRYGETLQGPGVDVGRVVFMDEWQGGRRVPGSPA